MVKVIFQTYRRCLVKQRHNWPTYHLPVAAGTILYLLLVFFIAGRTSEVGVIFGRYSNRLALLLVAYLVLFLPYFWFLRRLFRDAPMPGETFLEKAFHRCLRIGKYFLPLILCLLPLEIFLRLNFSDFFSERDIRRFHPFLQVQPLAGDKIGHVNSHGFRGREITVEKPAGTYRIFVLGGSTVFAAEMFYEKTHAAILEEKLKARYPERNIEVLNAGYPWYATEHSLIQYLFKIKDYDPDLVIMWHGINDFYRSFLTPRFTYGKFESDYAHFHGPMARVVREHFRPAPLARFHLVSMVYLIRAFYSKISADKAVARFFEPVEVSEFPSLEPFRRNLISTIRAVHSDGVSLILGTQPVLYRDDLSQKELDMLWVYKTMCVEDGKYPNLKSAILGMDLFNQVTREVAREYGVPLVDLEHKVPKMEKYFWDDCHYTEEGNARIADELFETIVDKKLIKRS